MSRILLWSFASLCMLWPAVAQARPQAPHSWKFKENESFYAEWNLFKLDRSRQAIQLRESVEELRIVARFTVLKVEPEQLVLEQRFGLVSSRGIGAGGSGGVDLFKNGILQITLDRDFQVKRIEGIEPLLGIQQGSPAPVQQKIVLTGLENQVRLWLQYLFFSMPENALKTGGTWQEKSGLEGAVFHLEKNYTYQHPVATAVGKLHQVKLNARVQLIPEEVEKKRLNDLTITNSDFHGTLLIDPREGGLVHGKYHCNLGFKGMMQPFPGARPATFQSELIIQGTVSVTKTNPLESRSAPVLQLVTAEKEASNLPAQQVNSLGMKLVRVPAGKFTMGSKTFGQQAPDEPLEVEIARPYLMGAHEVTIGQYRKFVEATGYQTEAERKKMCMGFDRDKGQIVAGAHFSWKNPGWEVDERHPVVNLSWEDAKVFCAWLSCQEGKNYRLPTEAEWEYACRAGTRSAYSSGDEPETLVKTGNVVDVSAKKQFPQWQAHRGDDGHVFTAPVGSFQPNAFGLYDMHGNALEWCEDWFFPYPRQGALRDPQGAPLGLVRVQRGGSFADFPQQCTSAHRLGFPAQAYCISSGFRVVLADGPAQPYQRPQTWVGQWVLPCDPHILTVYGKSASKEALRPLNLSAARVQNEHFGLLRVTLNGRDSVLDKSEVLPIEQAVTYYTEQLKETALPHLHLLRATAYTTQGKHQKALRDLDEAIQLDDQNAWLYLQRGLMHQQNRAYTQAVQDFEKAIEWKEENAWTHNALAWLLATCPDATFRDGKKALEHAQQARKLNRVRDGHLLDTLAAACAENGQFEDAVRWQNAALEDPNYTLLQGEAARQRLKLYEDQQPYHQP